MRLSVAVLVCFLLFLGPAAAEDEKRDEPKKPAREMTKAEREAALKRAGELNRQFDRLLREGKLLHLPMTKLSTSRW